MCHSREPKRVGIMGGTFDPIHIGHLMLAECAYQQFGLDRVLFLPSGNPPHKQERAGGATDRQRMEMVTLAISDNDHFSLDREEMEREGFSYTKDTLARLKRLHPDTEYYFIIGADSLMSFDTWREPEEICRRCVLAVAVRDQMDRDSMQKKIRELEQRFQARICILQTTDVDIASSRLREWIRSGRSVRYYVPDPVFRYIAEHGVYQQERQEEFP